MNFLQSLAKQFAGKPLDWDELEEALIRADLGVSMTTRILNTLQEREAWSLLGIGDVIKAVREEIARILPRDPMPIRRATGKPTVILIVGVNGTGKTTSTAKLAHYLMHGGKCRASVPDASAFHRMDRRGGERHRRAAGAGESGSERVKRPTVTFVIFLRSCFETQSLPALLRCYPGSFTFYLRNPFPRFLGS
jgi:hypothetical protein